ncbi:MAG: hypothetical protein HQ547_03635 [Candidatus Omnitrophica bacterium]|nr:hypothetical protein [Candidatus Omnitrophota bacterium]
MQKTVLRILAVFFVFLLTANLSFSAELKLMPKEGQLWAEAKGEFQIINMAAVKGAWEESAIKLDDGEIIILIGEPVKDLAGETGEVISVSGVLKPRMRYQGNLVRVIEVKEIK